MNGAPLFLRNNRVWRTYLGGALIGRWQGNPKEADAHFPEEWIASTVEAANPEKRAGEGLSFFIDPLSGEPAALRDRISQNTEAMLGKAHSACFSDMNVLIKILESAERLAIQVHPDNETARSLFSSPYGKAESWHILNTRGDDAYVLLGFRNGITRERWEEIFRSQDIDAMTGCLHKIPVQAGETYWIPGGVPHAIGGGCLILEVQQPTDLTIRTERTTPSGLKLADASCHQGVGFERMFDCFHYTGLSDEDNLTRYRIPSEQKTGNRLSLLGRKTTSLFAMEKITVRSAISLQTQNQFQVLLVWEGSGRLCWNGGRQALPQSAQIFIPAALDEYTLEGDMTVLLCHGPDAGQRD